MNKLIRTNSLLNLAGGGGEFLPPNYDYQYKNSAKEDNGHQGLINLASKSHCLIETPSLITVDNYKTNSLNNLNLQLHASAKVSNPFTFSITSDTRFGVDSIDPDYYTLTVGTDNGNIYGYMNNICGDITPKTYQGHTIINFYVDIVQFYLYLVLDVEDASDYSSNSFKLIIIDDDITQTEDIVFKYNKNANCYISNTLPGDTVNYFQAYESIKFRLQ